MIPIRDDAPRFGTPWVNYFLIAVNLVVFAYEFLLEISLPQNAVNALVFQFGFVPAKVTALLQGARAIQTHSLVLPVSLDTVILTIFTSMFMHASIGHVAANMWFLWIFGDNIEDYLGHFRYLVFYLLSGIGASLLHYVFNITSGVPSVGASGAIAGVMGAYLILFSSARVLTLIPPFFFVQLPAWLILGWWFVLQFLTGAAGVIAYSHQTSGGVAVWAHVGGFLSGIALIKLFPTRPRRYRFGAWYG